MKKTITIILILLALVSYGCEEEQNRRIKMKNQLKASIDACIEQGGIPIFSYWDNSLLKDCKKL